MTATTSAPPSRRRRSLGDLKVAMIFPYPANPNAADVSAVMTPAMDSVLSFQSDPTSLIKANNDVNQILSVNS